MDDPRDPPAPPRFATSGGSERQGGTEPQPAVAEDPPHAAVSASDLQIEWLVETYGSVLYKVALAVTRSAALAEEVVQDAVFQAWVSMPSWEGDVPIKWLRRVTRNRAISVMRKESRSTAQEGFELRTSQGADTERIVEGRELMAAVEQALAALDQQSRTMVVLRETEEVSYEELAELFDITPSAVKAKLYRARHAMKDRLTETEWEL